MDTDSLTGPPVPEQQQINLTHALMTAPEQIISIPLPDFQRLSDEAAEAARLRRERDSLLAHIADERAARIAAETSLEAATGVSRSRVVVEREGNTIHLTFGDA